MACQGGVPPTGAGRESECGNAASGYAAVAHEEDESAAGAYAAYENAAAHPCVPYCPDVPTLSCPCIHHATKAETHHIPILFFVITFEYIGHINSFNRKYIVITQHIHLFYYIY
ncbi:MAG: hypothetical protein ABF706_07440, partial [Novacetimonas hansenii]